MEGLPDNNPKEPKKSKFNYYWIYAIVIVLLLGTQLFNMNSKVDQITMPQFLKEMLPSGDVRKVVVVNEDVAEVFLKEKVLEQSKYEKISKNRMGMNNPGPHFVLTIPSKDYFQEQVDKVQESLPMDKVVSVEDVQKGNVP
jgi:AFG3 family protein